MTPALALLAVPVFARAAVVAELPKPGEYVAWVGAKDGSVVAGPVRADGSKIVLDTGSAKNGGEWSLIVDAPGGNATVQPVPKGDAPRISLESEMFNRIARVQATVTDKNGNPPDFATVTLTDGKGNAQTARLVPSDNGTAVFQNVVAGDGKLTVQQGDIANLQTITVRLPAERETPLLSLTNDFTLPDGMKTAGQKTTSDKAGESSDSPESRPAPLADTNRTIWGFLIAVIILGVIGGIFYYVLRKQGVTAKSALAKAGIQLPEDEPMPGMAVLAAAPEAAEPNICPFCGGPKDASGQCPNCAISGGPAPTVSSGSGKRLVAVSGPRAGSIFPLATALSIGRDIGRDIAIPEDASLSRAHAIVKPTALGTEVIDQNSSNGTWVNGLRVQDRTTIQPGDEIMVGSSRFRFEE